MKRYFLHKPSLLFLLLAVLMESFLQVSAMESEENLMLTQPKRNMNLNIRWQVVNEALELFQEGINERKDTDKFVWSCVENLSEPEMEIVKQLAKDTTKDLMKRIDEEIEETIAKELESQIISYSEIDLLRKHHLELTNLLIDLKNFEENHINIVTLKIDCKVKKEHLRSQISQKEMELQKSHEGYKFYQEHMIAERVESNVKIKNIEANFWIWLIGAKESQIDDVRRELRQKEFRLQILEASFRNLEEEVKKLKEKLNNIIYKIRNITKEEDCVEHKINLIKSRIKALKKAFYNKNPS